MRMRPSMLMPLSRWWKAGVMLFSNPLCSCVSVLLPWGEGMFTRLWSTPTKQETWLRRRVMWSQRSGLWECWEISSAGIGDSDEPEQVLGEVASISRNESLLGTLVKAQFYRSWVFARGGLEKEAARAAGEAMRIADEHGHIDFLVGEARVGTPILALADRYGHGEYIRAEIIPLLPSFLASYFYELAEGDTYPTDVNLGHPKYSRMGLSRLRRPYPSDIDEEVVGRVQTLTPREIEILEMIGEGMPNKVIAAKLYITEKTIKTHTHRIFRKLEVTNRLQAVLAFQHYQKAERLCLSKSPDRKARG